MISSIIDGVTAALEEEFPGVKVYPETVRQGLKEPCFILRLVRPTNAPMLSGRYRRSFLVSVQYIPESTAEEKAECYDVNDRLFRCLEYIKASGNLVRGTGASSEYHGGGFTFFITYRMFMKELTETERMEYIAIENPIKGR